MNNPGFEQPRPCGIEFAMYPRVTFNSWSSCVLPPLGCWDYRHVPLLLVSYITLADACCFNSWDQCCIQFRSYFFFLGPKEVPLLLLVLLSRPLSSWEHPSNPGTCELGSKAFTKTGMASQTNADRGVWLWEQVEDEPGQWEKTAGERASSSPDGSGTVFTKCW